MLFTKVSYSRLKQHMLRKCVSSQKIQSLYTSSDTFTGQIMVNENLKTGYVFICSSALGYDSIKII